MNVLQHRFAATEVLDRLLELTVLLNDDMARALAGHGLTVARTHLLWVLHHEGASTQRALSDALKVTPRNITGLVDGLVGTGLVTREAHPTDRRARLVTLTPAGASLTEELARDHRALAARLFGDLPAEQLHGLLGGIELMTERLRAALELPGRP
jgi:DNA-binding MarR family transcriptional regulator